MKIVVTDKWSSMVKDDTLIEKSEKLYIVEFAFDESWDGFTKTAIFTAGSVADEVLLTDNRCIIPSKCLEQAGSYLRVGVYGEKDGIQKDTVWCLTSKILYRASIGSIGSGSGSGSGTTPVPEEVRAQVIEVIRTNTATDEEVDDAINTIFGASSGDPIGPGEDPEPSDNTATDKEVDDILNDVFG